MFQSARLKLTTWYLLIIMLISILFSVAFYHLATHEIERVISRIEFRQRTFNRLLPKRLPLRSGQISPSLKDLEQSEKQIFTILLFINGAIFVFAGGAGYFLAGRTLKPIQVMIDEQNEFISSASHELRTPIATMRAEMEGSLLEKQISDAKARQLIISNLEELTTLQNLSNKLLEITHIHSANGEKYMANLSLGEIITRAQKKITPLANKKKQTITYSVEDVQILGDKSKLIEVFVIFLDNAIKYSPEKSTIRIASKVAKQTVKVFVSDEGIGIAQADLPHVFDRFYRADKSRSLADGYGLGLSIAKKIIEIHNGSISVESKEKHGTTFIVSLPIATES